MIQHSPFFFENWYNVGRAVTLSIIGFLSLIALLRVSGKRTLSKLNVFDFVFVVAVGSVFAATIMQKDVTLVEGIAALITLVGMQIGLAELAARSELAERIINGEPALLLSHGRFIPRALKRERITEEEVRAAIRGEGSYTGGGCRCRGARERRNTHGGLDVQGAWGRENGTS